MYSRDLSLITCKANAGQLIAAGETKKNNNKKHKKRKNEMFLEF